MKPDISVNALRHSRRLPPWLKVRIPGAGDFFPIRQRLRKLDLNTVCEEARCPNIAECWGGGTATMMVLGDTCTRGCRFCSVKTGNPGGAVDPGEPEHIAEAVAAMGLTYVVLTSVDRDDLADGGAGHFAACVRAIKARNEAVLVETLIPDFRGDEAALRVLCDSGADVIAQNQETVRRLTHPVRDAKSGYDVTLRVLKQIKHIRPEVVTKSSLMVGLGERNDEIIEAMRDLRDVGVQILTLGQYLRPSAKHLPVVEYVTPEKFDEYRRLGESLGFTYVASGPLVRSSYRAGELFVESKLRGKDRRNSRGSRWETH